MKPEEIKTGLLKAGVNNLKAFGYPHVSTENILTNEVYKMFFETMLKDNLGKAGKSVDAVINELLTEVSN